MTTYLLLLLLQPNWVVHKLKILLFFFHTIVILLILPLTETISCTTNYNRWVLTKTVDVKYQFHAEFCAQYNTHEFIFGPSQTYTLLLYRSACPHVFNRRLLLFNLHCIEMISEQLWSVQMLSCVLMLFNLPVIKTACTASFLFNKQNYEASVFNFSLYLKGA